MVTKSGVISTVDMIKCLKQIRSQKVEVWKQSHYYVKKQQEWGFAQQNFSLFAATAKKAKKANILELIFDL